jgi:transcriptional regulator with XRE-family HTH domain
MQDIGSRLRSTRTSWGLSLREVEERSSRFATQWGNSDYRISASWLDRVERGNGALSAAKLIVLAAIYNLRPEQVLGLCSLPVSQSFHVDETLSPNSTLLLSNGPLDEQAKTWLPESLVDNPPPQETTLLPSADSTLPTQYRRGIIGRLDRTLEPMIPAGSFVLIDTRKRAIASRKEWNHEFDRPIYFLLTRTGYVSGFCELDRDSEWLTLVPHALSHETSKRWRYRKEIEVIGTVAAVCMRRVA